MTSMKIKKPFNANLVVLVVQPAKDPQQTVLLVKSMTIQVFSIIKIPSQMLARQTVHQTISNSGIIPA